MNSIRTASCWMLLALLSASTPAQSLFNHPGSARRSRTFDAVHYALVLSFNEPAKTVTGSVTVRLTPLALPLDSILLDAVAMNIRSVTIGRAKKADFQNSGQELSITLDRRYAVGETLSVTVNYSCTPTKGMYFIKADSGAEAKHDQIWTQGEDMDNRYWFPCYDYPNDKASSEVTATVAEDYTLLSNGRLVSETHDRANKTRTFHWVQSKPHSSYLIMLAAGRYVIMRDHYRDVPILYYVYPEDTAMVRRSLGKTPEMMKFFEERIGVRYPWEKYAQIIIDDFMFGGMENTSAVTLIRVIMVDDRAALDNPSDVVVSHELAHMWWGDLVTIRDWSHLWLNEGFASYCEALYVGHADGADAFQYKMIDESAKVRNNDKFLGRKPIVSIESHTNNLYARGSWVLYMLNSILGDEAFWRGMKFYLNRFAFGTVETAEFRLAMEDATGINLDWFFEQWLFKAGLPRLRIEKSWDDAAKSLTLSVAQVQVSDSLTGTFRFPLSVECTTAGGKRKDQFFVNNREETFHIPLDGPPLMVIADKGYRLLKELDFPKSKEEYIYQLAHAEDVADRITAARSLEDFETDEAVREALSSAALHDKFWGVRQSALVALKGTSGEEIRGVAVRAMADVRSAVRNEAAGMLSRFPDTETASLLDSIARNDSSYLVVSNCIRTLAEVDTPRGFELARYMIGVTSYRNQVRHASLLALRTTRDPRAVKVAIPFLAKRYDERSRQLAVALLGDLGKNSVEARDALRGLLGDSKPSIRGAAVTGFAEWDDPEIAKILQEMEKSETDSGVRQPSGEC